MDSAAQLAADGSARSLIPDLQATSLASLARHASDGDGAINDLVARIVDGVESPAVLQTMIFNSAI
jgi:hypothetical protein